MYSDAQVAELLAAHSRAISEIAAAFERSCTRPYRTIRGKEYGQHGLCRRLRVFERTLDRVFTLIPPKSKRLPNKSSREDAEIQLHAFITATYGAIDNLAWIWVCETSLKKSNGHPLPKGQVGLRPDNQVVVSSLPPELQEKVLSFAEWFAQNDEYRHALAHRIPPYIPPYAVRKNDEEKHEQLAAQIWEAVVEGDTAKEKRLRARQRKLKFFDPVIQHSWGDSTNPVIFHAMLIADSRTIVDLANAMFDVLDSVV